MDDTTKQPDPVGTPAPGGPVDEQKPADMPTEVPAEPVVTPPVEETPVEPTTPVTTPPMEAPKTEEPAEGGGTPPSQPAV